MLYKTYSKVIHGGGIDLKNTHHYYEGLLFNCLGLKPIWLHVKNVTVDGEKMSKSRNSVIQFKDIPYSMRRYLLLSENPDCKLELGTPVMVQKQREFCKIVSKVYNLVYGLVEPSTVYPSLDLLNTGSVIRYLVGGVYSLQYLKVVNQVYRLIPDSWLVPSDKLKIITGTRVIKLMNSLMQLGNRY